MRYLPGQCLGSSRCLNARNDCHCIAATGLAWPAVSSLAVRTRTSARINRWLPKLRSARLLRPCGGEGGDPCGPQGFPPLRGGRSPPLSGGIPSPLSSPRGHRERREGLLPAQASLPTPTVTHPHSLTPSPAAARCLQQPSRRDPLQ
jgi:hypothetical protein